MGTEASAYKQRLLAQTEQARVALERIDRAIAGTDDLNDQVVLYRLHFGELVHLADKAREKAAAIERHAERKPKVDAGL